MNNTAVGTSLNSSSTQTNVQNQTANTLSYKKLAIMWLLIFLGYFVFVVQWYSIGNFGGGWGAAFFPDGQNALVASVPNWMITFGRSIGSILAGYWIAKLGHKYAVMFVLGLMVIAFPFIIVAQNQGWNSLSLAGGASTFDGTAVAGFSLFVIFRIFLAVGGTTLISYTNSVIARMPADKKVKHMTLNQFAFNGGALFANIFFVIPGFSKAVNGNNAIWTGILSAFVVLALVLMICYYFIAEEVVPKQIKTEKFNEKDNYTLTKAFKDKEAWPMYFIYIIWLISVVFLNSSTVRSFIEQSPANALALVKDNIANNATNTAISKSVSYFWVWPAFICMFVAGFIVALFTITKFSKTIFKRKLFIATMMALGYLFMILAIICGYFGGYGNQATLALFLIFSFVSGIFLWGAQPVIFTIAQQQEKSNPQYMGVVGGMIWGVGYMGYTVVDASLSSIVTYVDPVKFGALVTSATEAAKVSGTVQDVVKPHESAGMIVMMVMLWVILALVFVVCKFLPTSGYRKDGKFIPFEKTWSPLNFKHLMFTKPEFQISNN